MTIPAIPDATPGVLGRRDALISRGLGTVILAFCAILPFPGDVFLWPALLGLVSYALLARRHVVPHVWFSLSLFAFVAWVTASVLWSVDVGWSVLYISRFLLLTGLGILIAQGRSRHELLEVVARACVVVLVASWVVALLLPSLGRTSEGYEAGFKGLFVQRNNLGYFAVLSLLTLLAFALSQPRHRRIASWLWVALALATVYASQSRTALAVSVAVIGIAGILALLVRARLPAVLSVPGSVILLGATIALVLGNFATLLELLGRDATLTGRTEIWTIVRAAIAERPFQGYGWGGLWNAGTPVTEQMWAENGYPFYHAHNGYLDVTAQVGVVGSILALIFIGTLLVRAIQTVVRRPDPVAAWPLMFVAVIAVYNATEVVAFTNTTWVLLVALSSTVARDSRSVLHYEREGS